MEPQDVVQELDVRKTPFSSNLYVTWFFTLASSYLRRVRAPGCCKRAVVRCPIVPFEHEQIVSCLQQPYSSCIVANQQVVIHKIFSLLLGNDFGLVNYLEVYFVDVFVRWFFATQNPTADLVSMNVDG